MDIVKIGDQVAQYRITEKLGEGGMGLVFKAKDTKLGRDVALKFLQPNLIRNEESKRRFVNEARAASRVNHPSICTIHEIGATAHGQLFIAMEFYEGETLEQRISRGMIPLDDALDIAIKIGEGLQQAHAAGIVHRDIKPANIMITPRGAVKILDFGLAKLAGESKHTRTGAVFGTQAYMSPEQTQGREADQRSDIWSLGVMLYEMVTEQLPFSSEYEQGLAFAVVSNRHVPVKRVNTEAPKALSDVIDRCLMKKPQHRYPSMSDLLNDLQLIRMGQKPERHLKSKWIQHRRSAFVAMGVMLLLFLMVFISRNFEISYSESQHQPIVENRLTVLPFGLQGDQALEHLKESVTDLLAIRLDGTGEIQRVDPIAVYSHINESYSGNLPADAGVSVARHFGAEFYVQGTIYQSDDNLKLAASLYRYDGSLLAACESKVLPKMDYLKLADDIGLQLIKRLGIEKASPDLSLESLSTASHEALSAFMAGEAKLRTGQYTLAVDDWWRAVQFDSTFALAWLRLAVHRRYSSRSELNVAFLVRQAVKYQEKLSQPDRDFLSAYQQRSRLALSEAEQGLRRILRAYPHDWQTLHMLNEILGWYAPLKGQTYDETRKIAARLNEVFPNYEMGFFPFEFAAVVETDKEALIRAMRKRLEIAPESNFAAYLGPGLAYLEGTAGQDDLLNVKLSNLNPLHLGYISQIVALLNRDYETAENIASYLLADYQESRWKIQGYMTLAFLKAALGKWREGNRWFVKSKPSALFWLQFNDVPYNVIPPGVLDTLEAQIVAAPGMEKHIGMALLDLYRNDLGEASIQADSLEQASAEVRDEASKNIVSNYINTIRAKVNYENGHFDAAWNNLQQLTLEKWNWGLAPRDFIHAMAYERFLRARVLRKLGRPEAALRWLRLLGSFSYPELIYKAPKHHLMAEIFEEMGEVEQAITHYEQFIWHWRDCDPVLKPQVVEAEKRVERLKQGVSIAR